MRLMPPATEPEYALNARVASRVLRSLLLTTSAAGEYSDWEPST